MITANEAREIVKINDIMPKIDRLIESAAQSCHTSLTLSVPVVMVTRVINELRENGFNVKISQTILPDDDDVKVHVSWAWDNDSDETDREEDLEQQHKSIDELAKAIMEHEKQEEEFEKFIHDGLHNFDITMDRLRKLKEE